MKVIIYTKIEIFCQKDLAILKYFCQKDLAIVESKKQVNGVECGDGVLRRNQNYLPCIEVSHEKAEEFQEPAERYKRVSKPTNSQNWHSNIG